MADLVQSLIAGSRVMVFSKSYCPYCTKAKNALQSVGLTQYGLVELDGNPRCDEVQDALEKLTGGRSVPRVFVDGKFIGGGDDTAAMARDGRLKTMLTSAGILSAL